mgnify:FL=1
MTNPEFPKPPKDSDIDYGVEPDDQPSMVADDADVSVVAAHLARLALDALLAAEESDYPFSAYVIGLRAEWIFTGPFQTFPILLKAPPAKEAGGACHSTAFSGLPGLAQPAAAG